MTKNILTKLFYPEALLLPVAMLLIVLMFDDRIGYLNFESGLDGFQASIRLIGIWFALELSLFVIGFFTSNHRSYNIRWLMLLILVSAIPILTYQQIEERSIAMVKLAEIESNLLENDRVWRRVRDDEENEIATTTYAEINGRSELTALNFYLEETDCGCCFSEVRTDFSNEDARWLKNCRYLETMDLTESSITDDAFLHFQKIPRLTTLDVSNNQITGSGFKYLAGHPSLKSLVLDDCPITDGGLQNLASVTSLEKISLYQTPVTDVGIEALSRLPNLESLTFRGTRLAGRSLGSFNGCLQLKFISIRCDQPKADDRKRIEVSDPKSERSSCIWNDLPKLEQAHVNVDASIQSFEVRELGKLLTLDVKFKKCLECKVGESCNYCKKVDHRICLENLPNLVSLKVEGVSKMETSNLPNVSHLVLSNSDSFLPRVREFSRLKSLEIVDSKLTLESLRTLGEIPGLESLTIACADENSLLSLSQFANLKKLKVTRAKVGQKGAEAISELEKLEELELVNVRGDNSPLSPLNRLKKLRTLKLNYGEIDRLHLCGFPDFHYINAGVSCEIGRLQLENLPALESFYSSGDIDELTLKDLASIESVRKYSFDDHLLKSVHLENLPNLISLNLDSEIENPNLNYKTFRWLGSLDKLYTLYLKNATIGLGTLNEIAKLKRLRSLIIPRVADHEETRGKLHALVSARYSNLESPFDDEVE